MKKVAKITISVAAAFLLHSIMAYSQEFMSDIDGNNYLTIEIGTQVWTKENLRTTRYNDGTAILEVTDSIAWTNLSSGAYTWYDNNEQEYEQPYGKLYNSDAVHDSKGLCPTGWHIPKEQEWMTMMNILSPRRLPPGGKMKESGLVHWESPNTGATNESGFTGLPGGVRNGNGAFNGIGKEGIWWISKEVGHKVESGIGLSHRGVGPFQKMGVNQGFSVRCLRD